MRIVLVDPNTSVSVTTLAAARSPFARPAPMSIETVALAPALGDLLADPGARLSGDPPGDAARR